MKHGETLLYNYDPKLEIGLSWLFKEYFTGEHVQVSELVQVRELVQVLVSLVSLLWLWRFVFLAGSHKWRFVEWIEQEFPVDPNSRGSCMANIG